MIPVAHPETDPDNLAILRELWSAATYTHPDDHADQTAEARKDDRIHGRDVVADWAGESR